MTAHKRRSLRNPPRQSTKRPTLAEQWDAYDAAVIGTMNRNYSEREWVEQGEEWARNFVSKPFAEKMMDSPSFNPESDATEMWSDAASETEVVDGLGWMGVQVGFVDELEHLTGRKFKRFNTADSAALREKWRMPITQVQKLFKRPRGARS